MKRGMLVLAVWVACGARTDPAGDADARGVDAGATPQDVPAAADAPSEAPCTVLFGLPNEKTGLGLDRCRPECDCEGRRFVPPTYSEEDQEALLSMTLLEPFAEPSEDPYAHPEEHVPQPGKVCGLRLDPEVPGGYRLATYDGPGAASAAGAQVTHWDACGVCSPLKDLVVYMRHPDLTEPVRQCGLQGIVLGDEALMNCLLELGFDRPCARIWFYNTKHTGQACQATCMQLLDAPYHLPDGSLNDCLRCDEEQSGPVFKAVAGRTRRNTGLPSSMCRPCEEVQPVLHRYLPGK